MTIDKRSWGYRRQAKVSDMLSTHAILTELVVTVSCGGNLLLNIGPSADGRIIPLFEERLKQVGAWLKINGESIYKTSPWSSQNDTASGFVWYTKAQSTKSPYNLLHDSPTTIYAIMLKWPSTTVLNLGSPIPSQQTEVSFLGYSDHKFQWVSRNDHASGMHIHLPTIPFNKLPSTEAWVFKITNVTN